MFRIFPDQIESYTKAAQQLVDELSKEEVAYFMELKSESQNLIPIQNPSRAFQIIDRKFDNHFTKKIEEDTITFSDLLWDAITKKSSDFLEVLDNQSSVLFDDFTKYLEQGYSLDAQDINGNTIMHYYANELNKDCHNETIKKCLYTLVENYGADINIHNRNNLTPLQCILNIDDFQIEAAMFLVMDLHADPTVKNINGDTLLHIVIKKETDMNFENYKNNISQLMNLRNNNIHMLDAHGKTSLYYLKEKTRSTNEALMLILNLNAPLPSTPNSELIPSERIKHDSNENEIQYGSTAKVYLGTYDGLPVSIKAIDFNLNNLERCNYELEIMQKLMQSRSKHIVNLLGYAINDNKYYIIMQYVTQNLRTYINRENRLPQIDRLKIMLKITYGISVMHHQNILHRDIKPENVLIEKNAGGVTVKICDFGVAKEIDGSNHKYEFVGSIGYIPRENLPTYQEPHTKASDIFALGITFWEVAHLKIAYAKMNYFDEIEKAVLLGYRERIDKKVCPSDVGILINECLENDPNYRPSIDTIECQLTDLVNKMSL